MYGLQALGSWVYDDNAPFIHIEANETYARLRARVEEGYFEELVKKYLLENPHAAMVVLEPREGLAGEQEAKLAEALAETRKGMSQEEIAGIHTMMDALNAFREDVDSPEDLAKIPLLNREDMKREAAPLINEERSLAGCPALYHEVFTNGIA